MGFAIALLFTLTNCSPLVVRYDSEDIEAMHKAQLQAEQKAKQSAKEIDRIKDEYRRLYETWNEADEIIGELEAALHECQRN